MRWFKIIWKITGNKFGSSKFILNSGITYCHQITGFKCFWKNKKKLIWQQFEKWKLASSAILRRKRKRRVFYRYLGLLSRLSFERERSSNLVAASIDPSDHSGKGQPQCSLENSKLVTVHKLSTTWLVG